MKEYKLNDNERKVLITTIINTKRSYFSKLLRRKDIAQFESIESITDIPTYSDMEAIENQFYMDELLRIAKPYLTRKEFNVLKNAVANAENNFGMDASKLYVSECFVCPGPTLKRLLPRAKGSADRLLKRSSHVTIALKERA